MTAYLSEVKAHLFQKSNIQQVKPGGAALCIQEIVKGQGSGPLGTIVDGEKISRQWFSTMINMKIEIA